jgi:adenylate cyclase
MTADPLQPEDPFRPSPELVAIVRRYLAAYGANDAGTVTNLYADSAALRYIGSAEDEYWDDATLRAAHPRYMQTKPLFDVRNMEIEAFERGPVGYAIGRGDVHLPATGKIARVRFTHVLTLDRGLWRIVHAHHSSPVANIDNMGYEAQGVEELLRAATEDRVEIGQTGMASIMFTDIADSTRVAEALGDSLWSKAVRQHLDQIAGLIEAGGGRLVKSLGDGTMSTFPSARAALAAARTIQQAMEAAATEPRLPVRIGIHTGEIVDTGDDFFGTVVNKAARVAAWAGPDEVAVSDATRVMVGSNAGFAFSDPVAVPLKGLDGEHLIHRLEWRA